MITPAKGTKKQVLGGMLVCLGAITALLARTIGFELDNFYVVISIVGGCLFLYGTIQKNNIKCLHSRINLPNHTAINYFEPEG